MPEQRMQLVSIIVLCYIKIEAEEGTNKSIESFSNKPFSI